MTRLIDMPEINPAHDEWVRGPGRPPVGKVHEVRLPPDLAAAVRHAAKSAKVSAAEIHRRALAEYLNDRALLVEAEALLGAIDFYDYIKMDGVERVALERRRRLLLQRIETRLGSVPA